MDPIKATLLGVVAVLAVVMLAYLLLRRRRNPLRDGRAHWFTHGLLMPDAPDIRGVVGLLMDMNVRGDRSAVVVMADGSTSLYWPTGAVIGAGFHEPIRTKSQIFLDNAVRSLNLFGTAPNHDLPEIGKVRVFAWTRSGIKFLESSGEVNTDDQNPLSALLLSGNEVITAVAEHLESRAARNRT